MNGEKHDQGKDRWDLLPFKPIREVVKVLTFGATKYDDDNWQKVENPKNRYFSAAMRHMWAWKDGEVNDDESGFHHLAHAVCCLLFAIWFDFRNVGAFYNRTDHMTDAEFRRYVYPSFRDEPMVKIKNDPGLDK